MQYCEHCNVNIRDRKKRCPLCQNPLASPKEDSRPIFPKIPIKYDSHMALRILIFLSITIIVSSFAIYMLFPVSVNWPKYVILTTVCIWLILIVAINKRNNITKSMLWQVGVISLLAVFWDWITGWKGWSIDYVIPLICVAAMAVLFITAKVMNLQARDYLFYLLLVGLYGLVPILFIVFGWVNVLYPSIICITLSIISLAALLLFQGENIKDELDKRMHV